MKRVGYAEMASAVSNAGGLGIVCFPSSCSSFSLWDFFPTLSRQGATTVRTLMEGLSVVRSLDTAPDHSHEILCSSRTNSLDLTDLVPLAHRPYTTNTR